MNSRERVLAALNHQQPDRPPIDLSGHRASGIAAIAYARLRKYLGLPQRPIRIYDMIQQLAIVDEDVLDLFGIDTIELGRGFALDDQNWHAWVLPDGTPCQIPAWIRPEREPGRWVIRSSHGRVIAHMPDGALYFEQTYYPFAEKYEAGVEVDHTTIPEAMQESMWTAIISPPGPLIAGADEYQRLADGARGLRQRTDRAILGLFGGNLFELGTFLYRIDNFLMLMAADPTRTLDFMEACTTMYLTNLEKYLTAVGPYIDIVLFNDDFGAQNRSLFSLRMFRDLVQPYHHRLWQRAKALAPTKIMLHSCGSVREFIPSFIKMGLDTLQPVQISARGMEATGLKKDFGQDLTFWGGGCDTHHILPKATPEEVRQHVNQQVSIFAPGGGFVFQQVHNIMADVPAANIVAMLETVRDYRE